MILGLGVDAKGIGVRVVVIHCLAQPLDSFRHIRRV